MILEFRDIDTPKIYALICNVYRTSQYMSDTLEERYPAFESFERYANELSGRTGAIALAEERDGRLRGYLTILPRYQEKLRHTSDLNMGVHHEARGMGIGKALLGEALRRAGASGFLEIIYLMVRSDNTPAVRLYEHMGFDHLALLKNDIRTPDGYYDGYLMRKFIR